MSKKNFQTYTLDDRVEFVDYTWLISGIVYEGGADKLLEALRLRGINECYFYNVAGNPIGKKTVAGVADSFDVETFHVVVAADQADNIFDFIYEFCEMSEPNKGIVYMNKLSRSTVNLLSSFDQGSQSEQTA